MVNQVSTLPESASTPADLDLPRGLPLCTRPERGNPGSRGRCGPLHLRDVWRVPQRLLSRDRVVPHAPRPREQRHVILNVPARRPVEAVFRQRDERGRGGQRTDARPHLEGDGAFEVDEYEVRLGQQPVEHLAA